jgi:hypothetical protein
MTPNIVGAAGVINFDNTSVPSTGLIGQGKGTAYGDFAAKVWLHSLQPVLVHSSWTWPDPASVPGTEVPYLIGKSMSDAREALSEAGFKLARLGANDNLMCPSSAPIDTVGYFGPQRATPGSTITVCISTGVPPIVIIPRPPSHPTVGQSSASSRPGHGHGGSSSAPNPQPSGGTSHTHGHGHNPGG